MEKIKWDSTQKVSINVSGTQYDLQAKYLKPMREFIEEKIQEHRTFNPNFDPSKQPISIPGHKDLFNNIVVFFFFDTIKIPADADEQQTLVSMARDYGLSNLENRIKESK